VFRDTLSKLIKSYGWLARWVVAPLLLGAIVIAGAVLLYRREVDFDTFLNYFALGLLIFVVITLFYGIIAIHDIPYEIAHKRNHPHQDAIHAAGWVSLFTLHALWPFLWIWAMLFRPERGWGFQRDAANAGDSDGYEELLRRIEALEVRSKDAESRKRAEPVEKHIEALKRG